MTSMAKFDEVLMSFDGKSPRDAYKKTCEELGVHTQAYVYELFPEKVGAFHTINTIELDKCLLGTKGCMALLPIIRVSSILRKISIRGCGVSDEFVKALCEILETHPSVRFVDISDNQLVTVYSAPYIINVMRHNSNLISFEVSGTHVGKNVGNIISDFGQRNVERVTSYYQDRYFKMKDLFNYLDENGTGWVHLKSLVMNCPYPVLQEQFVERIALKKPKKRSDSSISINTFLQLIYMNYKTDVDIAQYLGESKTKTEGENKRGSTFGQSSSDSSVMEPLDEPYLLIVANWKQIIRAVERYNNNIVNVGEKPAANNDDSMDFLCGIGVPNRRVKLPEDFHRLRLRDYLLTDEEASALVTAAASEEAMREVQENPASGENAPDKDDEEITLSMLSLLLASKTAFEEPPNQKPVYQFYKERDASYIPDCVRHGSRLVSLARLSMLDSCKSSRFSMTSMNGNDTVEVLGDPPRTFSLPPCLVKAVVNFFNAETAKESQKARRKTLSSTDSPRSRRDKAMEKACIPVSSFLGTEFATEFETILPRLLGDYYARYSLPIEDSTITLQEMVNLLDEMYVVLRVDRLISLAKIMEMEDPMIKLNQEKEMQPIYKDFCTKYIRDEAFLEAEVKAKRDERIRMSII
ncbi:unnamed protein product [Phytomonas sp. EM1]|nr:unnamed protein product [Phytomonas sp. EM1]|eukprot:CCW62573.1 unnamed protein product [Phytomonas sp. isolate EM1]